MKERNRIGPNTASGKILIHEIDPSMLKDVENLNKLTLSPFCLAFVRRSYLYVLSCSFTLYGQDVSTFERKGRFLGTVWIMQLMEVVQYLHEEVTMVIMYYLLVH